MQPNTATISVRLRPETATALEYLLEDGASKSEAVQAAVIAAARNKRNEMLLRESTALLNDADDVAEMQLVAKTMDSLSD